LSYEIVIPRRAQKSLARLRPTDREKVRDAIFALSEDPRPHGVRTLKGKRGDYLRLRVGDYRVIYQVQQEILTVLVIRVGHRREVYRNL
jgi:mRNA interferase RelE/StbE